MQELLFKVIRLQQWGGGNGDCPRRKMMSMFVDPHVSLFVYLFVVVMARDPPEVRGEAEDSRSPGRHERSDIGWPRPSRGNLTRERIGEKEELLERAGVFQVTALRLRCW